jgi:proline dehydrogenase
MSRNRPLRSFSEKSAIGKKLSSRFVAGTEVEHAVEAARAANQHGISATLDSLGENVYTAEEAHRSANIYHQLLDAIHKHKLDANVSLKLTQMGMDVDPSLAESIVRELVEHAVTTDNFVRVDMEGTEYTQATIDMVRRIHREPNHGNRVGTVIQAYLYRSEDDIKSLVGEKIRIRLCKGAYKEPPDKAFPKKSDVDANYLKLTKMLLTSGVFHGIATHDENIIAETKKFVREQGVPVESFEFQMLYGVRRELQLQLRREGYRVRAYIPFGNEWYPYFMRRLAERPANAIFIARQFFKR